MIKSRNRPSIAMARRYAKARGYQVGKKIVVIPPDHQDYPLPVANKANPGEGDKQEITLLELCRVRAEKIEAFERAHKQMRKAAARTRIERKRQVGERILAAGNLTKNEPDYHH